MPSPFPGMNPYLEYPSDWPDFHGGFLVSAKRSIIKRLPERYQASIQVRTVFREASADDLAFTAVVADPALTVETGRLGPSNLEGLRAPVQLSLGKIEEQRRWLRIYEISSRRIVTIVELLTPEVKWPGKMRREYWARRRRVFDSTAHLVEIDLLRRGRRPASPPLVKCDYYALVSKASRRRRAGQWPIALGDSLPVIPIPLLDPDPPVPLDLQAILDECYDESAYERDIYTRDPVPPLSPEDAAWAESLIPAGVRRD